jgi:hypothetical protein
VASWLFFLRRGGSTRMNQIWALRASNHHSPFRRIALATRPFS